LSSHDENDELRIDLPKNAFLTFLTAFLTFKRRFETFNTTLGRNLINIFFSSSHDENFARIENDELGLDLPKTRF